MFLEFFLRKKLIKDKNHIMVSISKFIFKDNLKKIKIKTYSKPCFMENLEVSQSVPIITDLKKSRHETLLIWSPNSNKGNHTLIFIISLFLFQSLSRTFIVKLLLIVLLKMERNGGSNYTKPEARPISSKF